MKKLLILLVLLLVACDEAMPVEEKETIRNVDVIELSIDNHQAYASYIGHVTTGSIYKRAFQVSGRLDAIHVQEGDKVSESTLLAEVNTETLTYQLDAAKAELKAAKAQYSKAKESLSYTSNIYTRTKRLFNENVASSFELEQAELNYKMTQDEVTAAQEMINQATVNVDAKQYLLDHSSLYARQEGLVMDILFEAGDLVSEGYPVVLLRDTYPLISFGVTQNDLMYLTLEDNIAFTVLDKDYMGEVISISQIPDKDTQTYQVELQVSENLPIGSFSSVSIQTEMVEGTKVPLSAIRSDGEDYVFIVIDDHAQRVNIDVIDIQNQEVIVKGLPDTCRLVTEGIMALKQGDKVKEVNHDSTN